MTAAVAPRRSWLWLQGLLCGAALSFATGPVVLVAILLLPGLAVYALERTPGKPLSEAMLLLGLATAFTPIRLVWDGGNTIQACIDVLGDPSRVGTAWIAAGMGWLIGQFAQIATGQFSDVAVRRRVGELRREREELVAEWGALGGPQRDP